MNRYFVDHGGVIYTVFEDGKSNYNQNDVFLKVKDQSVILTNPINHSSVTYPLHESLIALAKDIEQW